ncbi:TlpA disulfide reductase family protein [Shouchella shacheensis]|uniref:TlpA disulfide reductase family protein n=1 Tax=Shouchella shacheensis TaxID=1649580 RepID=UPI00073FDAB0|nr:TlpA disulfide reductase family protein [Shouchella shacheensis]
MRTKRVVTFAVLILAAVAIFLLVFQFDSKQVGVHEGNIAEDFTLGMHEATEGSLSDYEGDVIVLNVWASWCTPCVREMPALMELADAYENQGVSVVTVNWQTSEVQPSNSVDFIEEQDITLPVFFDAEGAFSEQYGIRSMPTTYIINRDFVIEDIIEGEVHYEMMEERVHPLL